jgi:acetyl-CoA acyltransferase
MTDAYILSAVRTAIGKRKGGFAHVRPDDLMGDCLNGLVQRAGVAPAEVEDVIVGCVTQMGEQGMNVGRTAVLAAGWPVSVPGTSVNRMCASGLQSVNFAAQAVMAGAMDLVVGGGVESMTRVAMGGDGGPMSERILDRFDIVNQGISAELISERYGFSRRELDELAVESHRRALSAIASGHFEREILPVNAPGPDGVRRVISVDEGPRAGSTFEALSALKPAFKPGGVVTAASSSQISDGAAAVLVGSLAKAQALGVAPRARIRAMSVVGTDPTFMLLGPAPATALALKKAGMNLSDIDLFEINEAFAPVVLAWAKDTGADLARTNISGGAMALGHPLGCSGARLLTTLLHALERENKTVGLATLCIGWGLGVATIIERV